MVDKAKLFDTLFHHVSLYESIISKPETDGDKNRAKYGLKEAREIRNLLDTNPTLTNSHLKQIHSRLTNMARGVEYFDEYEMEKRKRELGKEVYLIKMDLEKQIKW